ncbi:MAG: hypothetical protein HY246_07885 [Proteobacteria bacterium]|nr:hypothetical protein [Pseudomonadota bacterium]
MADIPITLTCADYARVMPLAIGDVKPEGIALTLLLGSRGAWPVRAEMLRRALEDKNVHGGEASVAQHLYRIDKGDRSHVGLPVFPLRNFTARDIYVRKDGSVRSAADRNGKRLGMYSYTASGSVWYRHLLRYLGVDLKSLQWWIGSIDTPYSQSHGSQLPPGVKAPPGGRALSEMLIAGELDAILSPPRPQRYKPGDGPIVRLFPNFRTIEREYFRKTGAYPTQHLIVIRRAAWEANTWIARALTAAFIRCNDNFTAAQRQFPYATPWLEEELEETAGVMGEDFHPYGVEPNRTNLEMFSEQAHLLGLTSRRVSVEEYFQEFLTS